MGRVMLPRSGSDHPAGARCLSRADSPARNHGLPTSSPARERERERER